MIQDNPMLPFIAAIIFGLIGLGVGVAIGAILSGLRTAPGANDAKANRSRLEIARLWRERSSSRLLLEIDGKTCYRRSDLSVRQRNDLAHLLDELQLWLDLDDLPGGRYATPPAAPPPAPLLLRPAAAAPSVEPRASASLVGDSVAKRPAVVPASVDISDILSPVTGSDPSKTPESDFRSIATQIDELIQERLPKTDHKNRMIRLRDSIDGGITVLIDDKRFAGIGEVPDPSIRQFLQECVAEWNRKTGGV